MNNGSGSLREERERPKKRLCNDSERVQLEDMSPSSSRGSDSFYVKQMKLRYSRYSAELNRERQ
jgi:hypothetical protein